MNKLLFLIFSAAALVDAQASVRLDLFSGRHYFSDASTPMADGQLLLLIASTQDSFFSQPTADSFVGGSSDDLVLAAFDLQSATAGFSGSNLEALTFSLSGTLTPGDPVRLVWFPTLPYSSTTNYQAAAPGAAGISFGTFRTDAATVDGSTSAWIVPGDGQNHTLNFATQSVGGSQLESAGRASQLTGVPEPSTAAVLCGGLAMLGLSRRWGTRRKSEGCSAE